METLINIHPVDELAAIREEIKQLSERESVLRAALLADDADLKGDMYDATIIPSTREIVDKNALIAELGREAVQKFLKSLHIKTVRLVPHSKE